MKKITRRSFLQGIGASSAMLALSGCNETTSTQDALTDVSFPLAETATITIMTKAPSIVTQPEEEKVIFKRLEERTNVYVECTTYVEDQFIDKRNLALAKPSSLPDILFNADMSAMELLKYGQQGVIITLNELIDQYMPNFSQLLDANPTYRKMITAPDGNIYSLPWIEQLGVGKEAIQSVAGMPFINQKWLTELNLPMPKTTEEFEQTLLAFKSMGENVIPMSFMMNHGNEDVGFILGAFGFGDTADHIAVDENGKVVYTLTDGGYKDGVEWLHKLYAQNLIDLEVFTHDWATYVAKGKNDQYGVFFGWDQFNIAAIPADFVQMPALEGPSGIVNAPRPTASADSGFFLGRTVVSGVATNLELIARWLDLMYEPIQSVQNNWGTYGDEENFNIFNLEDDGTLTHNELGDNTPWESRVKQMIGGPLAIFDSYYGKYVTLPPDATIRMDAVKTYVDDMKYDMVYPNVFMNQEDAEKASQLETDITTYAQMKKADWVLNGGVAEQWEEYLAKMEEYKLSEYLQIKQKYLDDYLA